MSKELDRLRHLVVKMQVRYGETDPDVRQLVEDVNALEAHEARERRPFPARGTPPHGTAASGRPMAPGR